MYRTAKMIKYDSPRTCIIGTATVTLVNHYKVKKITWIRFVIAFNILSLSNGLVDSKKDMRIGWHDSATLAYFLTIYFDEIFFVWVESVNGLIG